MTTDSLASVTPRAARETAVRRQDGNATNGTDAGNGTPTPDESGESGGVVESMADGVAEWAVGGLQDATQAFLGLALDFMLSTPTPETAGEYVARGVPSNEPYATLYTDLLAAYAVPVAAGVLLVAGILTVAVLPYAGLLDGGEYRVRKLGVTLLAGLVGVVVWWGAFGLLTSLTDALIQRAAPSPAELTASLESVVRLSVGSAGVGIALGVIGVAETIALLLIYAARHVLIMAYAVAMPVLIAGAVAAPVRAVRSLCREAALQFLPVLLMPIPTALALRVGFVAEWDFGAGPVGDAAVTMSLWGIGVIAPVALSLSAFSAPTKLKVYSKKAGYTATNAGRTARRRVRREQGRRRAGHSRPRSRSRHGRRTRSDRPRSHRDALDADRHAAAEGAAEIRERRREKRE